LHVGYRDTNSVIFFRSSLGHRAESLPFDGKTGRSARENRPIPMSDLPLPCVAKTPQKRRKRDISRLNHALFG
jgi:hypothetical protein